MSAIPHLETAMHEAEKLALVTVLRAHPEWTVGSLLAYLEAGGDRAKALRALTMRELLTEPSPRSLSLPNDDGPVINIGRLERAKRARDDEFDQLLVEVLAEAGRPVQAAYLRARLGGPRWKLQAALGRLVERKQVHRTGSTSATHYAYLGHQ